MNIITFQKKKELDESGENQIIVTIDIDKETKKIICFCILQLGRIKGKQIEIVKYDSCHGECHVHKYYTEQKHPEKSDLPINQETINYFKKEIIENWRQNLTKMMLKED